MRTKKEYLLLRLLNYVNLLAKFALAITILITSINFIEYGFSVFDNYLKLFIVYGLELLVLFSTKYIIVILNK